MMNYHGHVSTHGFGFGIFDVILHVALIVFLVWLVFALLRGFGIMGRGRHGRMGMWHAHSALSILNERFAKGEIDAKEYEERKKALLGEK